jgi:hypothetical protein
MCFECTLQLHCSVCFLICTPLLARQLRGGSGGGSFPRGRRLGTQSVAVRLRRRLQCISRQFQLLLVLLRCCGGRGRSRCRHLITRCGDGGSQARASVNVSSASLRRHRREKFGCLGLRALALRGQRALRSKEFIPQLYQLRSCLRVVAGGGPLGARRKQPRTQLCRRSLGCFCARASSLHLLARRGQLCSWPLGGAAIGASATRQRLRRCVTQRRANSARTAVGCRCARGRGSVHLRSEARYGRVFVC